MPILQIRKQKCMGILEKSPPARRKKRGRERGSANRGDGEIGREIND